MNKKISIVLAAALIVAKVPAASATETRSSSTQTSLPRSHTFSQPNTHQRIAANRGGQAAKQNAYMRMEPSNNADLGG